MIYSLNFILIFTADVLESFATHPPLLLPTTDFQLDLKIPPEDDEFVKCLRGLCQSFGGEGMQDFSEAIAHKIINISVKFSKIFSDSWIRTDTFQIF